ncbi:MAG TPA: MgtC/SapB family protein [Candidatus Deferrimicrobiaceae bacterium]|nr:MgtC/SapB family protein [Candidatus Deferrimicrobiaceae bacterium]
MIDLGLQVDLATRLIVASLLGLAVGFEREIHGHPAGLRTHMLVALGSGLFTVLSAEGFGEGTPSTPIDPTRIAAQIVSGIGFLGAGAILKDGIVIRGLTTAASLWAIAAVGMAAGAGEYLIATVAAAVILVSLWPINILSERLHGSTQPELQLRIEMDRIDALSEVTSILRVHRLEIGEIGTTRQGRGVYRVDLTVRSRTPAAFAEALEQLARIEGVDILSTSHAD